jgi:hypothetical protein
MSQIDWSGWHSQYANPRSWLALRLRTVQHHIRAALDASVPGELRAISICAGQGHDLLEVLAQHPRGHDVRARLVELDARNVAAARARAGALELDRLDIIQADASVTDAYLGSVPADLIVLCGVFGNLSEEGIRRAIAYLPRLSARGATVVWTRHTGAPDLTPTICDWFREHEFRELRFERIGPVYGVGSHQFHGTPCALEPGVQRLPLGSNSR